MPRNKNEKEISEKFNAPFPTRLRILMAEQEKTQEDIAKAVGKTRQTVSQYVNGVSEPGFEALLKIAALFGTSIDYLLGKTNDPHPVPSATDDLGLSAKAVNAIYQININREETYLAKSLSAFLESPYLRHLLLRMSQYSDAVRAEISYLQSEDAKKNRPIPGMLGMLFAEQQLSEELAAELKANHPELIDRITVICGSDLIAQRMEELKTSFETLAHEVAGTMELDRLRLERG